LQLRHRHPSVPANVYEIRPGKDRRGVDLISDARLWYDGPNAVSNAVGNAKFYSRSQILRIPPWWRQSNHLMGAERPFNP
jgi:hypothetical protein